MTVAASETLETGANIQYLCMQELGEALRHFYLLYYDVEITATLNVEYNIKDFGIILPPYKFSFKQTKDNVLRNK